MTTAWREREMVKETFVVHVTGRENSTWQGQVTWLDERETRSFRSMLELIKLIDAAMEEDMSQGACR